MIWTFKNSEDFSSFFMQLTLFNIFIVSFCKVWWWLYVKMFNCWVDDYFNSILWALINSSHFFMIMTHHVEQVRYILWRCIFMIQNFLFFLEKRWINKIYTFFSVLIGMKVCTFLLGFTMCITPKELMLAFLVIFQMQYTTFSKRLRLHTYCTCDYILIFYISYILLHVVSVLLTYRV